MTPDTLKSRAHNASTPRASAPSSARAASPSAPACAARDEEGADARGVEAFFARDFKVFGVIVEDGAVNAPHVVLVVGVMECHAALVGGRREAAAHHHGGVFRQYRREGMGFDVHGWAV